MIGFDTEIGITHPDIKECDDCGGNLSEVTIENHSAGGWFKGLECDGCSKQFNIRKFNADEYSILTDKLRLENYENTHSYCDCCGIVFEKYRDGDRSYGNSLCPICVNIDDDGNWDEAYLQYLNGYRNRISRKISEIKKAKFKQ